MLKKNRQALISLFIFCIYSLGVPSQCDAENLTEVLGKGLDAFAPDSGEPITVGARIAPALATAIAQAVNQELPLTSVAPAFTYRYNPTVDTYERDTSIPGPLFSERALTLGAGQLNFGVGYSFVDFDELNGKNLNRIDFPGLQTAIFVSLASRQETPPLGFPPLRPGEFSYLAPVIGTIDRTRLTLQANVVVPTFRYGITDRWDVSIVLPILNTFLRIRSEKVSLVEAPAYKVAYRGNEAGLPLDPPSSYLFVDSAGHFIPKVRLPLIKSQFPTFSLRAAGHATGVGDIVLRSKYRFWTTDEGGAAFGLILQLPSGDKRNLQGTGEYHISPFLYFSQVIWKRIEPHLNLGIDFNANDVNRSSFLYTLGITMLMARKLGIGIDLLGRSEFAKYPVRYPSLAIDEGTPLNKTPSSCTSEQPCQFKPSKEDSNKPETLYFPLFPEEIKRNDIINFSFGLRYTLGESGSVFFGGILPLNNDGFRASFIPTGGIDYSF